MSIEDQEKRHNLCNREFLIFRCSVKKNSWNKIFPDPMQGMDVIANADGLFTFTFQTQIIPYKNRLPEVI